MAKRKKRKTSLILKSVWTLILLVITCVLIFSPKPEEGYGSIENITKIGVVVIFWLIAIFAFIPGVDEKIGNREFLKGGGDKIITYVFISIVVLSFIVMGFLIRPMLTILVLVSAMILGLYKWLLKSYRKKKRSSKTGKR